MSYTRLSAMSCNRGVTLIECLISVLILSILSLSILSVFYVAKVGNERSRHRITAMNIVKQYMEAEILAGYSGGGADYYATVDSAGPFSVIVDGRDPATTDDDLLGTLSPDPYYPDNVLDGMGTPLYYPPSQTDIKYKKVGFVVQWSEQPMGRGAAQACSERALVYVSEHKP